MSTQGNFHFFANWAKERLDEMDAALTSLEGKAAEVHADARDKASKVLAELSKNRDAFRDAIKDQRSQQATRKDSTRSGLDRL